MFEAQGYHETTVPNIAVRARVPVGSVYEYFMDKTALYLAVLDKQWDEFISGMHEALASTTDAAQRLRAVVEEYFVQVERRNTTLLFDRQVSDVAEVRERLDRFTSEWADVIKDVVATDHDLSDEASKLVAVGVAGATQAVGRSWLSDEACVPRSEIVRTVMDLVLHGIVSWTPPNTPPSQSPPSPH
jgi:AcrR family transcriptional regulator